MAVQSRKWMILAAATWIQAFTGTNFDFSSYSSSLKSVVGMSQVQLSYLSVASDMGKAFGWCSGVSLLYFPLWVVMFIAAFMGLVGYGVQWLVIKQIITLPYILVFLLCLMAGCSICWFNTVCYVLCIRNFPTNRALALSLTISFNGVSAALYTLLANAINPKDDSLYLLSNALIPLVVSALALLPIILQPPLQALTADNTQRDHSIFLVLNILAVITGLYLLLLNSLSTVASTARILLGGAVVLLVLPLLLPWIVCAGDFTRRSSWGINTHDLDLFKGLIRGDDATDMCSRSYNPTERGGCCSLFGCCDRVMEKDRLTILGEEHPARLLARRWDFWLYYMSYFCGGTIGIVYSNNLGQIAQSLGYDSQLNSLVTIYSTCSFFGRLLSAAPDFLQDKVCIARTGWFALALLPTPVAFVLLALSGSEVALHTGTALISLSSGFVFSSAVSITSELFGANSAGVNHNILITNIPIGSLLYGLLAATIYEANAGSNSLLQTLLGGAMVCMGRQCYLKTFIIWGCISLVGLFSSFMLFQRTKAAYDGFRRNQKQTEIY